MIETAAWVTPAESSSNAESLHEIPIFTEELAIEAKRVSAAWSHYFGKSIDTKQANHAAFFGFSKLLIVYTTTGKLYALASQTVAIVWRRFLGPHHRVVVTPITRHWVPVLSCWW